MMKKLILLCFVIQFYVLVQSQNIYYNPVIIYSLSENTIVRVNGEKVRLDSMLVCSYNEQIEIIKGTVGLYNGDELKLNEGKVIKIVLKQKQREYNQKVKDIDKISRFINEPSVYLPNLYSAKRSYFTVFPLNTKVLNPANIKIYFQKNPAPNMSFKLYSKKSDSLIWETNNLTERFDLSEVELVEGASYYWRIYNGIEGTKGEFELLSKERKHELLINKPGAISDYLEVFFLFLENDCKFDAIAILSKAIDKFPDCKIFKNIANRIPVNID